MPGSEWEFSLEPSDVAFSGCIRTVFCVNCVAKFLAVTKLTLIFNIGLSQFQASVREQDGSHNYHRNCHHHPTAEGKWKDKG